MAERELSLVVVGAGFPNSDGSNRQFEIAMCNPGEPMALRPEPRNRRDPSAVAVITPRDIQIGYLSAERCGWIGGQIRQGLEVEAIFQHATKGGAVIRVRIGGGTPTLPPPRPAAEPAAIDGDGGFWPDDEPTYD